MNQKRILHLFAEPLARKTLLRLLAGSCAKASILFVPPELQMDADVALRTQSAVGEIVDEDTMAIERSILGKIRRVQPLATRGATPQGVALLWALY